MISGEGLRRGAPAVLGTLLHEAAHALAAGTASRTLAARAATTTSTSRPTPKNSASPSNTTSASAGPSPPSPDDRRQLRRPARRLSRPRSPWAARRVANGTSGTTRRSTNLTAAGCPAARSIRIAASTLAEAPVTCGACDGDFTAKDAA